MCGAVSESADWIGEEDFAITGAKQEDLPALFEETKVLIERYRFQIDKIAKVLIKKRKLSGRKIRKLIGHQ